MMNLEVLIAMACDELLKRNHAQEMTWNTVMDGRKSNSIMAKLLSNAIHG